MPLLTTFGALTYSKFALNSEYYLFITNNSNITFSDVHYVSSTQPDLLICGNTYNGSNPVGLLCQLDLGDNVLDYPVLQMGVKGSNTIGKFYRISSSDEMISGYANTLSGTTINWYDVPTSPGYPIFYGVKANNVGANIYNWSKIDSTYAYVLGRTSGTLFLRYQNYTNLTPQSTAVTSISGITTAGNNKGNISLAANTSPIISYGKHFIKCSNTGNITWQKTISDNSNITDSLAHNASSTLSLVTDSGVVMQCDNNGNIIWQKQIANANLQSLGIISSAGNIAVTGSYNNNLIYCGFANNGNIIFQREISGVNLLPQGMSVTTDATYIVGNTTTDNGFLISLPEDGNLPGNINSFSFANFTINYGNTNATIATSNLTLDTSNLSSLVSNSNSNIQGLFYNTDANISFSTYGFGYLNQ